MLQNLDGGGSSVSVKEGKVIDRPTCLDNSIVCERAVTSIACIYVHSDVSIITY